MNTIAQLEHANTFTDELPTADTLDWMEELFISRRREMVTANNRRIRLAAFDERFSSADWQASDERLRLANELTRAEMNIAKIEEKIVKVARKIVAEDAAAELRLNRLNAAEEAAARAEMVTTA